MNFYEVDFWMYCGKKDDYDNHYLKIEALSEEDAKQKVKSKYPRAKNLVAHQK